MPQTTTLHVPMDRTVRQRLQAKAKRLGFDSAQAYIRVWAKAEIENRTIGFGDGQEWPPPSPKAAARLNRIADEAIRQSNAGKLPSAHSVKELMRQLNG